MEDNKHWIEKLFPPHFTVQDFFSQSFEPEQLISEKISKEKVKNVEKMYHNAAERCLEAGKWKRKEELSNIFSYDPNIPDDQKEKEPPVGNLHDNVTCPIAAHVDDQCIWRENELKVLRHEMQQRYSEGAKFKNQLDACKLELSELKAKDKNTEQELGKAKEALTLSKTHIRNKGILVKQLQKDKLQKDSEIQSLKKDLHEKSVMINSLNKNLCIAGEEIQELKLKSKDLEQELITVKQQQGVKEGTLIENLKRNYILEKNKLLREIENLKEEERKREKTHSLNLAALDLLRKHFSSQSINTSTEVIQLKIVH
ncbi:coiled-coil domain-containing protein 160 homolog [Xenopus tropicalis]|uniref:Coiled-coil domain-containing protein 160 homolog n=1 Tax=Xenopus tropicalis TaxID=8364 RepID=CC160_XENTR|nr:coiled-coil domain-containing protein 160 homolog [Xenopus tropicalis]A9JSR5.1 RecName: Full=Coiled-coil domain-containing protein 160 homolog [Xenopus tropicalis]AAI55045.1 LOC100127779 protein [Xenopus tropicalis]|eukprot:NP_001106570.1 coiled-coil domain-containing protein 160 homolog [Xenopus tropicalis]